MCDVGVVIFFERRILELAIYLNCIVVQVGPIVKDFSFAAVVFMVVLHLLSFIDLHFEWWYGLLYSGDEVGLWEKLFLMVKKFGFAWSIKICIGLF